MIYLQRLDPARNMARFYCLTMQPNLFGEWSVVRAWGRLGQPGRLRADLHATEAGAQEAMQRMAARKRRKGYTSSRGGMA